MLNSFDKIVSKYRNKYIQKLVNDYNRFLKEDRKELLNMVQHTPYTTGKTMSSTLILLHKMYSHHIFYVTSKRTIKRAYKKSVMKRRFEKQ